MTNLPFYSYMTMVKNQPTMQLVSYLLFKTDITKLETN